MSARQTPPAPVGTPAPAVGDEQAGAAHKKYSKRAALYLRVSTDKQTVENQELILREVAERAGWQVVAVYKDEGISGTKGRDKRPGLDAMLKDATRRKFDVVMSFKLDRLARSTRELIENVELLRGVNVDLYLHGQAIDTTTPAGKLMFHMLAAVAEFERDIIVERVNAGLARARAQGKRLGRPPLPEAQRQAIRAELAKGTGIKKAASLHGVGVLTVQRIKSEMTIEP